MSGSTGGRALVAVVTVGLVVGLAGCTSGAGSPGTLPPVSSAPTTSSAATPTPSPQTDEAAIEAAVRSYFDAMDEAARTGKVEAFEAASLPTCPCRAYSAAIADRFASGELIGAGVHLSQVKVSVTNPNRAVATVVYETSAYVAKSDSGKSQQFDASQVTSGLVVILVDGRWVIKAENVVERS